MADKKKRLPKKEAIQALISSYSIIDAGIEGITEEMVVQAVVKSNQFLYESEVEAVLIARLEIDPDFNTEKFVEILEAAKAIKATAAPKFGEGNQVTIDSEERALQVANAPEHAPQIMDIMKEMKALREKVAPLISDHATVSIALKNKKVKEEEVVPPTPEAGSDPIAQDALPEDSLPEELTETDNEFLEEEV